MDSGGHSGFIRPQRTCGLPVFNTCRADGYDSGRRHECGSHRNNMGSTVILLTGNNVEWLQKLRNGTTLKMGELIGHFPMPEKQAVKH